MTGKRIAWVDYAKGIAIFGVVMWHVVGGVANSAVPTGEGMSLFGDLWDLYTFRLMPIFFFISGAYFVRSLARPFKRVLNNKLSTIVYPYVVWSVITLMIGTLTLRWRNGSESLADLPRILYDPILHFWFLFALFVIMIVTYLAYKARVRLSIIAAVSVLLFIFSASTVLYHHWYVAGQIGYFAVYFLAGLWVGPEFMQRVEDAPTRTHLLMLGVGAAALVVIPITDVNFIALVWQSMAATIAMIMTINAAVLLARWNVLGVVHYWGTLSLEIYLVHVLALSSTRIMLYNFLDVTNPWLHIAAGIVMGLYAPIILVWVLRRLDLNLLFVLPSFPTRRAKAPDPSAASQ